MDTGLEVSIVINVYNEEENIGDCLGSLKEQSYSDFELIVVDDGSTDSTMDIVEDYREHFELKTYSTPHVGIKKARRKGVKETTGDIIVVIDADEILEPDFLEEILSSFEDDEVGAVGGVLRSRGDGWVTEAYGTLSEAFYGLRTGEEEADWIQGGCSAYRKKALDEVGGLAREKVSADKDISWKMKKGGWKVLLNKDAVAYHRDPQTIGSVMNREYNIGKREFHLISKHTEKGGWKELSRFYPLIGLIFLGLSPLFYPLALLVLFGFVATFLGTVYLIYSYTEEKDLRITFTSWVVFTLINLSWSLGFLVSPFSSD